MSCFNESKVRRLARTLPPMRELERAADRHKAMGHPVRLAILDLLSRQECCVCDLAQILGKPVSTVSQHLQTLKSVGLLEARQEGKLVFYSPTRTERREADEFIKNGFSIGARS